MLKRMTSGRMLFPYHHLVSDESLPHIRHLYSYKNPAQFKKDLDYILKYYSPVSPEDVALAVKNGRELPSNGFLLSFDDGYREVHDVIAPILKEKGLPAIFFINPAFLDNRELFYRCKISLIIDRLITKQPGEADLKKYAAIVNSWAVSTEELIESLKKVSQLNQNVLDDLAKELGICFADYLQKQRPFLSTEQVKALSAEGFAIGAHSWDHPYYHLIPAETQDRQTISSVRFVKENFDAGLNLFSFPHSDKRLDQAFFDRIGHEKETVDLYFGIQNQKEERHNRVLHRFNAESSELFMTRQLNGMLVLMIARRLVNRNNVIRK
jgi:peptidoglycan/xylan/chitin deacetylase (PgdA/CDA1 family)